MQTTERMVREPERREITGDPTSTWYEKQADGLAPPAIRIGKRAVAWPLSELVALNAARIAGKSEDEIRALVKRLLVARASE